MAEPTGFLEYRREEPARRSVDERVGDYFEYVLPFDADRLTRQAARCMDCGIPFCHGTGCPLENLIPEFNDLIYRGRWRQACNVLHATNNFPEITGRICPAPCEAACTLNINDDPVLIKQIELEIVERGFREGWVRPQPPQRLTGRRVAIIGSGPAGLACAQQLRRAGHDVVVFEKDRRVGGLLRYGIPDFKLDKRVLDRRLEQMAAEGVEFECDVQVGEDISAKYLRSRFDAICLTMGAGQPRELAVPGRGLENVHFAMDYLAQQNRRNAGEPLGDDETIISARDKIVVVIGGGDTGSDCVGTAVRQGAKEVHLFEILPRPPEGTNPATPWPLWPNVLRTSGSHEEGCRRRWSVKTTRLSGAGTRVYELHGVEVDWVEARGRLVPQDRPGTEFSIRVDLVLLAMGFVHVVAEGLIEQLDLRRDRRGNVVVDEASMTSEPGVFAAGDTTQGASLVVRAIAAGRQTAADIDRWLARQPAPQHT